MVRPEAARTAGPGTPHIRRATPARSPSLATPPTCRTTMTTRSPLLLLLVAGSMLAGVTSGCAPQPGAAAHRLDSGEFRPLFNGRDLSGWRIPEGDGGHWRVIDGVIDYDALSQAPGEKDLYTEEEFGDYVLRVDWRIKEVPWVNPNVPMIKPDGSHKRDEKGNEIRMAVPDSDSGIYPRGHPKGQANIWNWPIGSGEIYGYRTDPRMPPEVRAAAVPRVKADRDIGEWNTFEITLRGDRMSVVLNDQLVIDNAQLPEIPARGPIGLQHHGHQVNGQWASAPSLVQFRNIHVRELDR
jgi:hypothetical protein